MNILIGEEVISWWTGAGDGVGQQQGGQGFGPDKTLSRVWMECEQGEEVTGQGRG